MMTNTKMTNTGITNSNLAKDVAKNSNIKEVVTKATASFDNGENFATSISKSKSASPDLVLVVGEHNLFESDPDQMR